VKVPTNPCRIPARKKRKKKPAKQEAIYAIRGCAGCVAGCKAGNECVPIRGHVHGRCLAAYSKGRFTMASLVDDRPEGGCLYCKEPLSDNER